MPQISALCYTVLSISFALLLLSLFMAKSQFITPSKFLSVSWLRRFLCLTSLSSVLCLATNLADGIMDALEIPRTKTQSFWTTFFNIVPFYLQFVLLTASNLIRYKRMLSPLLLNSESLLQRRKHHIFVYGSGALTVLLCVASVVVQLTNSTTSEWTVYIVGPTCLWIIAIDCLLDLKMISVALSHKDGGMRKTSTVSNKMSEMGNAAGVNDRSNIISLHQKQQSTLKAERHLTLVKAGFLLKSLQFLLPTYLHDVNTL
jgi:hypothetical protein